jgi:hypothetical protein
MFTLGKIKLRMQRSVTIPEGTSSTELEAIKKGSIIRGMSVDALYLSWGFPIKKNDWGLGTGS